MIERKVQISKPQLKAVLPPTEWATGVLTRIFRPKRRLEKTIESLARRLEDLNSRIEEKNGQLGMNMSECPVKNKDFGG
jgi:hypothetical protein